MSTKFPPPENQKQKTIIKRDIRLSCDTEVRIRELLRNELRIHLPQYLPEDFWSWETKKGKFPKRLKKYVKHEYGVELPNEVMGVIGDLVHTYRPQEEIIWDVDYELDWEAGDFGDDGSCFWSSNIGARYMIREEGGFAFRIYDPETGRGRARAWVYEIEPGIWVLWNGYGYDTETMASFLSRILGEGYGYKEIKLSNHGITSGTLYINGGAGYVVGPKDDIDKIPSYDFRWSEIYIGCCRDCESPIDIDYENWYSIGEDEAICESCFQANYVICDRCCNTGYILVTPREWAYWDEYNEYWYCADCWEEITVECSECKNRFRQDLAVEIGDECFCPDCAEGLSECDRCGCAFSSEELEEMDGGEHWCELCKEDYVKCDRCGEYRHKEIMVELRDGSPACFWCGKDLGEWENCVICGRRERKEEIIEREAETPWGSRRTYCFCREQCVKEFTRLFPDEALV